MNNKVLKYTAFPNLMAPDEEKATLEYGLQWAKAIEYEWWYRPDAKGSLSPYYDKRQRYNKLRLYGRGEQSTEGYAKLLGIDKSDFNYTNYDLRPIQVIPKFVKLLSNQMSERLFEVTAEATDKFSTDLKSKQKETLERLKISKNLLVEARDLLGVDLLPEDGEDGIPNTQEEIDLHMKLKYKPNVEIATEEAIKYTLDYNDYEETQSKVIEDIVVIGIGAVKTSTDPNKGIVVEYVDPAEMVYSYPVHKDHRDVYYYGQMKRMTVTEAKRISNGQITNEDLKKSSQQTSNWATYNGYSNERYYREEDFEGTMVDVLTFTFKALNTETYKKKPNKNGGFKLTKKSSSFQKPDGDEGDYEVIKKDIEVWYKGSIILGTDLIFNYGLCENMVRPKANLNKTYPMYTMYAPDLYQGREKSLVSTIIPYVDQMQQIHIKIQQLIAKARPNGVWIDVDGLTEISMGDGGQLDVMELIKLYNETGNVLGSSRSTDGDYNVGRDPIRELKNGVVDGLDRLIGAYNHYMNLVRDAIGVPVGVDASTPHPDQA
ncbi:MAG: hypothetical protein KJO69_01040, partial [Gammaproteobacteria bacterium]|nr:hypothetical protein [Gammaproteobacteria bacterium]